MNPFSRPFDGFDQGGTGERFLKEFHVADRAVADRFDEPGNQKNRQVRVRIPGIQNEAKSVTAAHPEVADDEVDCIPQPLEQMERFIPITRLYNLELVLAENLPNDNPDGLLVVGNQADFPVRLHD